MVDQDGVYRAYLADGTIVDAARLTSEQVQTFVDARAPHLPEEDAARERQLYADVDGQNVPEAQLLNPAEELKPTKYLEMFPSIQAVFAIRVRLFEKCCEWCRVAQGKLNERELPLCANEYI